MIEVAKLSKRYGPVQAIRELSFRIKRGELVGFLGPNGAGKTTTLRILAGFLAPSDGHALVDGHDLVREPQRARRSIGYMPEGSPLYPELRVREYLSFRARLKGVGRRHRSAEIDRVLDLAGAGEVAGMLNGQLSRGFRQRVGLADALLGAPPVLILDEPTAGLDPNQVQSVRGVLRALAGRQTVLLSTHVLSEVEATCHRAIVIDAGRLVADGPIEELRRSGRAGGTVHFTVRGEPARVREEVGRMEGVGRLTELGREGESSDWLLEAPRATPGRHERPIAGALLAERLAAQLVDAGLGLSRLEPGTTSLEQVFSQLTRYGREGTSPDEQAQSPDERAASADSPGESALGASSAPAAEGAPASRSPRRAK